MQTPASKKLFKIVVEFPNGVTRTVDVKATTLEVAQARALKRTPNAVRIKKG